MNPFLLRVLVGPPTLLLAFILYSCIYNSFISPLKDIPGPFFWRLSRFPYLYSQLRGNKHRDILKLHKKYGPVVRICPREISYTNAAVWTDAWGHRQGHHEFKKDTKPTPVNGTLGILSASREDHSRFRRLLSHAFSANGLREQEPRIKQYVDLLMTGLSMHGKADTVNLVEWFNWTTFDLIGDLAFGESFGCLENSRTHPWIESLFGGLSSVVFFDAVRSLYLTPLLIFLVPKRLQKLRISSYEFIHDKIAKRVKLGNDRGDFFDKVLKNGVLDEEKAPGDREIGMTIKEMESNGGNLVLAGSETTATLLSGTVFQLLSNPSILDKAVAEIRSSFASEDEITIDSAVNLPYLLDLLSEAMRIYPPVPTFSGRIVPPGGDTVDGKWLPEGTSIHMVQYAAFHLEENFKRPEEFLPERWSKEGIEGEFRDDRREAFQPFSFGPRNCIGKNLAYAEMRLIMARLLWRFDLSISEGQTDWEGWVDKQKTYILWEKGVLWVDVKERTGI